MTQGALDIIRQCIANGCNDSRTADMLGVDRSTLSRWKERYSEVKQLYEKKAELTDEEKVKQVENALLKRAIGYTQTEVTRQVGKDGKLGVVKTVEKQVMPSTTAQIFWLKNRCGYEWDGSISDDDENGCESGIVVLPEVREGEE